MDENCTIYKTTNFIGKKWTLLILLEIYKGKTHKRRYSQLKTNLPGITPKILSARLKELEKEGMIKKNIDLSSFPIKCEYSLTKGGLAFIKIIKDIKKWALKWKFNNQSCMSTNCQYCDLPSS